MNTIESIENQLKKLIENHKGETIRVSYILSKLDFSNLAPETFNSKFTSLSILRLHLFRLIKGLRNYERLVEYLNRNQEEAFQLGFYKDSNNNIELPPKRTFNHILQTRIGEEQREQLLQIANKIISLSIKNSKILDLNIVEKTIKKKKKNNDRATKEAIKMVKRLVYPNINISIHHNSKFNKRDLLDVLIYVASKNYYANNGSVICKDDNPNKKVPSGDLMMHHFSKFKSTSELMDMYGKILDVVFNFAKREHNILQKRKVNVAFDVHKIPFYGKYMPYVCGGKHERGTSNFFQYLTCSIIVAGKRFILDVIPMHPADNIEDLLDKSLARIKLKVQIDKAYLDRGFDRPKVINTLKKHNIDFIMPKIRSPTVKAFFSKSEGSNSRIIPKFQIGRGKEKAFVNLVLVNDKYGLKRAFSCNFDIAPQLAYRFYEMYGKRWGIETSYRNVEHDFKPKTTTRNPIIRIFYFLFSCCLYNLWILANIIVSLNVYGKLAPKPIITAKRFIIILYKAREEIT